MLTDMHTFKQTHARQTDELTYRQAYRHATRSSLETKGVHFVKFLFHKRVCDAPTEARKRPTLQRRPRNTKNAQDRCLWTLLPAPQNDQLGLRLPSQHGLLVQEHANITKESKWTSSWLSQDTPANTKSRHFAKDILKKSRIH